jgi:hypothetical protein
MTTAPQEPKFLYPTSTQFPFDQVAGQIVRELERRNFEVPGITVEFHEYGPYGHTMRTVYSIKAKDYKIRFGRPQGSVLGGEWNDTAAVNTINIPQKELSVYNDESGPRLYLYVGKYWEKDQETFVNGSKFNSKLHKKPRLYLLYKGECHCGKNSNDPFARLPHYHRGKRPPLLVHDDDLDREYNPEGDEPKQFQTAEVMETFRSFLEKHVLADILRHPAT